MKVLAFDLDGTLITCEPRQSAVLRAVLLQFGITSIDINAVWLAKRNGLSTIKALESLQVAEEIALRIGATWSTLVEDPAWLVLDTCFSDSLAALCMAQEQGFHNVLVTARQHTHWLKIELDRLKLSELLDAVEIVSPLEATKQKANVLKRIKPLVFFGDNESDWLAANNTGIPFSAISRGQRNTMFLENVGIPEVWKTLDEALSHVLEMYK